MLELRGDVVVQLDDEDWDELRDGERVEHASSAHAS